MGMCDFIPFAKGEVGDALSKTVSCRINEVFNVDGPMVSDASCLSCYAYVHNIRSAYQKCTTALVVASVANTSS